MLSDRPQILIADNDEDVLIKLEHALESGGYTTVTALSHAEASKLIEEGGFDLCVLDDSLSDRSSIDVLRAFGNDGKRPLVIVTYHQFPAPQEEKQFRSFGVSAFVNKRAHAQLTDIVAQLLEPMSRTRNAFDHMT